MTNKIIAEINFFDSIHQNTFQKLVEKIEATQFDEIIIRLSSSGGDLDTAFTAYHYLRSLPMPLTMHNAGQIESAAVLLYLAADTRTAVPHSRFMLHPISIATPEGFPTDFPRIALLSHKLEILTQQYIEIFKERTEQAQKPIDIFKCLRETHHLFVNVPDAIVAGICNAIQLEPAIPAGATIRRSVIITEH